MSSENITKVMIVIYTLCRFLGLYVQSEAMSNKAVYGHYRQQANFTKCVFRFERIPIFRGQDILLSSKIPTVWVWLVGITFVQTRVKACSFWSVQGLARLCQCRRLCAKFSLFIMLCCTYAFCAVSALFRSDRSKYRPCSTLVDSKLVNYIYYW